MRDLVKQLKDHKKTLQRQVVLLKQQIRKRNNDLKELRSQHRATLKKLLEGTHQHPEHQEGLQQSNQGMLEDHFDGCWDGHIVSMTL